MLSETPDFSCVLRRAEWLPWTTARPRHKAAHSALVAFAALVVVTVAAPADAAIAPTPASSTGASATSGPATSAGGGFVVRTEARGDTDVNACSYAVTPGHVRCDVRVRTDSSALTPHVGTVSPHTSSAVSPDSSTAYSPAYLQSAYNASSATGGRGMTVAVVDAMDDPNAESDLGVYRSQFGLSACTTANGCFRKVNEDGGSTPPDSDTGWAQEISLDLDMVSALCPNCHILLVEADSTAIDDLGLSVNTAVRLGAKVVSNSYGGPEMQYETAYDSYYDHPGVAVIASTGDKGYGAQYPAASPYVTAVGGTTLYQASATGTRDATETVWSDSGSGCSAYEAKPSWQHDTGCPKRTIADVSADADPSTGVIVYDSFGNPHTDKFMIAGGTSASAPIIGGLYALAGTPKAGTNPAAYPYAEPSAFNDVTSGSNGSCSVSYLCTAQAGYDGPTGLGTPGAPSGLASPSSAVAAPAPQQGTYHPITPLRVLDTRTGTKVNAVATRLAPGASLPVTVDGDGASAVALNVTVTNAAASGFLSVGPVSSSTTSNLNFIAGRAASNLVLSQVAGGAVSVYNGSSRPVDVIADEQGYYTPDTTGSTFTPLASPTRVLDTRSSPAATSGLPGAIGPHGSITVQVTEAASSSTAVDAVLLNVTAVGATKAGYLSVASASSPSTSNVNFTAGRTVPNLVVTKPADDGTVTIYNGSNGTVHVVADVEGYDTTDGSGATYLPGSPFRVLDTRTSTAVPALGFLTVTVAGTGLPVPIGASAVVLNVTVVGAQASGFLSVASSESTSTSNLNFTRGDTVPNLVVTKLAADGTIVIYNGSHAPVDVIADIQGYHP